MTKYRKVENCGPVPYPDRSGRFLNAGDIAEGDDWEPLVGLGFVERLHEDAPVAKATVPVVTKGDESVENAQNPGMIASDQPGANDVKQDDDGVRSEEVDSSETGVAGDPSVSGRASGRRRR